MIEFPCQVCQTPLKANDAQAGQLVRCPTCSTTLRVPVPAAAATAAGDRAPAIIRQKDGTQVIRCPRCPAVSPINSNNCRSCGMPFTMEGTHVESGGASNGYCVASLVLGIIGIPTMCSVILPLLAILFGIIGYTQV